MKIPRNLSAQVLIKFLISQGYIATRQKGSHIRLTRAAAKGDQHITVPNHNPIKLGTLSSILNDVASQLNISRDELLQNL